MLVMIMMTIVLLNNFFIALAFLCWGSFLNVVAYRILYGVPFFGARSRCPHCKQVIAWYDLLPILSWFILCGKCRSCKQPISLLYPVIEFIALLSLWGIFVYVEPIYWIAYGILFSALIVTIRTDLQQMIILRPFTLGIIPLGLILSSFGLLPITLAASVLGAFLGFAILASIRYGYYWYSGQHGMGNGDPELLAAIGAFTGPLGCWLSLLIGSCLGSLVGIALVVRYGAQARKKPLPFGPFLAVGAFISVLFQHQITVFLRSL
jgi:leader peptidase (prepilin peptidase)/N-methyltransferase